MTMLFEMTGIVKRFGGLVALDRVDFAVREGEVMALVGDNGAGKSTLIKTMSGAYIPDAGEIRMAGEPVRFPLAAGRVAAAASRRSIRNWRWPER